MANYFSITAADSVKITDGTTDLSLNSNGSIVSNSEILNQLTTGTATSRTDTYTVPAGKYWILKKMYYYRANAGNNNLYLEIDSINTNFHLGLSQIQFEENINNIRLKAGDSVIFTMQTGTSGDIITSLYYEEYIE
jgi:hypothetical protein